MIDHMDQKASSPSDLTKGKEIMAVQVLIPTSSVGENTPEFL